MQKYNDFMKWSYIRILCIALGVLGVLLLFSCLGVVSSANSLTGSDDVYSAFGGASSLYSSISSLSSMYGLNFFVLIVGAILVFLKMYSSHSMDYKPGYLLVASIVVGFLCEATISSINKGLSNLFSTSLESVASSILTYGFLVLIMAVLQIVGGVMAFRASGFKIDSENIKNVSSNLSSTISNLQKFDERDIQDMADYLMRSKVDIEFSLNSEGAELADQLKLPKDYTRDDILQKFNELGFMEKRNVMSKYTSIKESS